jgi:putative endonuclease
MKSFYVYILTNHARTFYVGMTSDLKKRLEEHKTKKFDGFTARYNINQIVYYEVVPFLNMAIERECQLKGWLRAKKIKLIESMNPQWDDLSDHWPDRGAPGEYKLHRRSRQVPSTPAEYRLRSGQGREGEECQR